MKIALLGGDGESTNIVYNYLSSKLEIGIAIIEDPVDAKTFIKRRIKKLGLRTVVGQILFVLIVKPLLQTLSKKRISEIYAMYSLNASNDYHRSNSYVRVASVNSGDTIRILQDFDPDVVIVNGTRIISEKVLSSCGAKFINMHAGITPAYRGVHGAYWALYNKDAEHCGVTVHFVDKGIDTGGILYQAKISPTAEDNFVTYPLLQVAVGLELELRAVRDIEGSKAHVIQSELPSKLYSHPTIFQYFFGLLLRGTK